MSTKIYFNSDGVQSSSYNLSGHSSFHDEDNSFSIEEFKQLLKLRFLQSNSPNQLSFEIKNLEPPILNALRRSMMSEVPTIAFHKVHLYQNTGPIVDEVLCHRVGLIPLKISPDYLDYFALASTNTLGSTTVSENFTEGGTSNLLSSYETDEHRSIKFRINVDNSENGVNRSIYASDIKYIPRSKKEVDELYKSLFPEEEVMEDEVNDDIINQNKVDQIQNAVFPFPNILLTKIGYGQSIEADVYAMKGVGAHHAKFNPVCPANYRMMPIVEFVKDGDVISKVPSIDIEEIGCPMGVFEKSKDEVIVGDVKKCTTCRQCLNWRGREGETVKIGKVKNHFIFNIESVGQLEPIDILYRSVNCLKERAVALWKLLKESEM